MTYVKLNFGGDTRRSRRSEDLTDVLIAFLDGLELQALIYPELFPPQRQLELLDFQLTQLGLKVPSHIS